MTDAPPPATIVQIRPDLFRMVSFRDAPLFASSSAMYASYRNFFFNILLLISDSMINYNFAPVHAEATKKATFCDEIKSFWCEFLFRQCCTSHTSITYFWESIPPKGWGKFQVSPKWFTQVLSTLVNLSRQVQDVESAAREHYKIYMHCSIQSTDSTIF